MSSPDLDAIIQSPEAGAFLRMVTKGFYSNSYIGLWMYEAIGREWDEMREWAESLKNEIHPQTCTWSIAIWEWVYGFEPDEALTLEERRQRILSKILGVRPINPEILRRGIAAVSGADAEVVDFTAPYSFSVTLNVTNRPIPMERVLQYIRAQKPAHLSASVEIVFPKIETTLHVGGGVGAQARVGVPQGVDVYDFRTALHAGGTGGIYGETAVPAGKDGYNFSARLYFGGRGGVLADTGLAENREPPPATTILRTGGVCTILSNLSKGE